MNRDETENTQPLPENGLLYLSRSEINALADHLTGSRIRGQGQVSRSKALLLTPLGPSHKNPDRKGSLQRSPPGQESVAEAGRQYAPLRLRWPFSL